MTGHCDRKPMMITISTQLSDALKINCFATWRLNTGTSDSSMIG